MHDLTSDWLTGKWPPSLQGQTCMIWQATDWQITTSTAGLVTIQNAWSDNWLTNNHLHCGARIVCCGSSGADVGYLARLGLFPADSALQGHAGCRVEPPAGILYHKLDARHAETVTAQQHTPLKMNEHTDSMVTLQHAPLKMNEHTDSMFTLQHAPLKMNEHTACSHCSTLHWKWMNT